jgi:RNA polymerase sigma-70 factor, ECF subfamily
MLVDFAIIKSAQSGDSVAFNEIVLAYRKRILCHISHLVAWTEDVEDVAQEVLVRMYFSLDQLRSAEVFEPWLYTLTKNAAYDYLRKQKRRQEFRMSDLSEQQVTMADAVAGGKAEQDERYHKSIRESVDALLGAVSEADRILLMMKEVEGLSLKELKKIYKVDEDALKVRLFRARQRVLKARRARRVILERGFGASPRVLQRRVAGSSPKQENGSNALSRRVGATNS